MTYTGRPQHQSTHENADQMPIILLLAAGSLLLIFDGWMISVMWNWFVPTLFESMPVLSIGHAIGLRLVYDIFTFRMETEKDIEEILVEPFIKCALLIPIGWIVQAIIF